MAVYIKEKTLKKKSYWSRKGRFLSHPTVDNFSNVVVPRD